MALSSSEQRHLPPTVSDQRQERSNRLDWGKMSTYELRAFLDAMRPNMLASMFEMMGAEERHDFSERIGRFAKEGKQERDETDALLEMAKSLIGWEGLSDRLRGEYVPRQGSEDPGMQNVAPVTLAVAPGDVTLQTPRNRHSVTPITPDVTHLVTHSSAAVRAKRGKDGFYHCRECEYATKRAGTLRMHRFRKHPKNRM